MHRELRERLSRATGESDLVVVVFLDVRGFSSFAGMAESSEAALFLRSSYVQILDEYFPDAAFFKPTGDGLMIVRHFDEDSLHDVAFDSIQRSLELVTKFALVTQDDPMINFEVPGSLGVGIARGAATRLTSGDYTLDYSGRPLNLAARLMDLARPSGVVVDGRVTKGLDWPGDLAKNFVSDSVYVKGIADVKPVDIYRTNDAEIRPANRHPLIGMPHLDKAERLTFKEFAERQIFVHYPAKEPVDPDGVRLQYNHPKVVAGNRKHQTMRTMGTIEPSEVKRSAHGWEITFDYRPHVATLRERGVKSTWELAVRLEYTVASEAGG